MTAHVDAVKSAAERSIAAVSNTVANVDMTDKATVRTLTRMTFHALYGRQYEARTDTREYARIKWHVRRALSGDTGPGRGGAREGAGRPKGEQSG